MNLAAIRQDSARDALRERRQDTSEPQWTRQPRDANAAQPFTRRERIVNFLVALAATGVLLGGAVWLFTMPTTPPEQVKDVDGRLCPQSQMRVGDDQRLRCPTPGERPADSF